MKTTVNDFDTFFESMLTCALWSSTGEDGAPLDKEYSITDLHPDCADALKAHALSFWLRMWRYIDCESPEGQSPARAGYDFWLTSQDHGAGFWDGDWPKYGEMLTKLSKCYPEEMEIWFKE